MDFICKHLMRKNLFYFPVCNSCKMAAGSKHCFPSPHLCPLPEEAINLLLFMKIYYFASKLYEVPLGPIGY